ncbi:MAG: hypothetical protein K1X89_02205 [Myxococcaceae bacterium]|nr:hypothetical protein [Myxococcaceae bacterium]
MAIGRARKDLEAIKSSVQQALKNDGKIDPDEVKPIAKAIAEGAFRTQAGALLKDCIQSDDYDTSLLIIGSTKVKDILPPGVLTGEADVVLRQELGLKDTHRVEQRSFGQVFDAWEKGKVTKADIETGLASFEKLRAEGASITPAEEASLVNKMLVGPIFDVGGSPMNLWSFKRNPTEWQARLEPAAIDVLRRRLAELPMVPLRESSTDWQ